MSLNTSAEQHASPFWRGRPTFVTGATGLLGGWLVQRLLRAGAQVVCLVRDWTPEAELIRTGAMDRVRIVRGDIRDRACIDRTLAEYEITTVMHLAAQAIVGIAHREPVSTFEANIAGTWTLLEACRRAPKVRQLVLASSDKAYGEHARLPYDEDDALVGRSPYDVSKSCADLLAQSYAASYELPVAITRCGNLFGGGDLNFNRIVPGTIRSILNGENPTIRSDGNYVRDYLYVEDAADAYLLLAEKLAESTELFGQAFNFSTPSRITVMDLVGRILRAMNSELKPRVLNEVSNEIREQSLATAKAQQMLGWLPAYSLDEGLVRTIAWYRERFASEDAAAQ